MEINSHVKKVYRDAIENLQINNYFTMVIMQMRFHVLNVVLFHIEVLWMIKEIVLVKKVIMIDANVIL